jgi:hypothetical protein
VHGWGCRRGKYHPLKRRQMCTAEDASAIMHLLRGSGGQRCRRGWSHVIFQNWNSCECLTPEPAESIYRVFQTLRLSLQATEGGVKCVPNRSVPCLEPCTGPPTSSTFLRSSFPLPAFFGPTLLPTPKDIQRHSLKVCGSNSAVRYTVISREFIRNRSKPVCFG